ncbi:DUF3592 domain-containing protein [Catenuloplanes japonicus]|uniref:DUF3592 domain-containing protein n=1 Tax=Catenuloplanes japonicus TaxID=33876 RepID=UPI000526B4AF|nr:DUF3592 domain-containing protein [Catenuloplanes japonicus]
MIAAILCLILGCAGVLLAVQRHIEHARLLRRGVRSPGEVVREERRGRTSTPKIYATVIAYRDEYGTTREFVVQPVSSEPLFGVGERVEVVYQAGRPETATVVSLRNEMRTNGLFGFIGLGFIVAGVYLILQS